MLIVYPPPYVGLTNVGGLPGVLTVYPPPYVGFTNVVPYCANAGDDIANTHPTSSKVFISSPSCVHVPKNSGRVTKIRCSILIADIARAEPLGDLPWGYRMFAPFN